MQQGSHSQFIQLRQIISRLRRVLHGLDSIFVKEIDPAEWISIRNQLNCHRKSGTFFQRTYGDELRQFAALPETASGATRVQKIYDSWQTTVAGTIAYVDAIHQRLSRRENVRLQAMAARRMRYAINRAEHRLTDVRYRLIVKELRIELRALSCMVRQGLHTGQPLDDRGTGGNGSPPGSAESHLTGESTDE